MRKKVINKLLLCVLGAALLYGLTVGGTAFFKKEFTFSLFTDRTTLMVWGVLCLAIVIVVLLSTLSGLEKTRKKRVLAGDGAAISGNLENAHFMESEEVAKKFAVLDEKSIGEAKDGIILSADARGKKMKIVVSKPIHTLVIGTTGSGKTQTYVSPSIRLMSQFATQPSMVISDPKGELLTTHGAVLKARGYRVETLDLRNPYYSSKWNPLEGIYLRYQAMTKDTDDSVDAQVRRATTFDEIYEELSDIANVLCPIQNKNDSIWESGARSLLLAVLLAMLEDSEKEAAGMTVEKFNFYNMARIASHTDNDCAELKEYFAIGRKPLSRALSLSKQVLESPEKQRGSYLSTLIDKLRLFSDRGVCSLTSKNDMKLDTLDDAPTALFLLIPDEREGRHALASLFILQAYKELVKKANTYEALCLKRSVYFLLDEFGNLPKLEGVEKFITVGRSRKIFLVPVVQSFSQLDDKYGKDVSNIIRSNCNIQIYIGTKDETTNEAFSKSLGNYSVAVGSVSQGDSTQLNVSQSVKERPLVYPSELGTLNNDAENGRNLGNTIVSLYGHSPMRGFFTPFFLCEQYEKKSLERASYQVALPFCEEDVCFDLLKRNKMSKPKPAGMIKPAKSEV